jgi:hypothetical protein
MTRKETCGWGAFYGGLVGPTTGAVILFVYYRLLEHDLFNLDTLPEFFIDVALGLIFFGVIGALFGVATAVVVHELSVRLRRPAALYSLGALCGAFSAALAVILLDLATHIAHPIPHITQENSLLQFSLAAAIAGAVSSMFLVRTMRAAH